MKVCLVGLGYIGLPTALIIAKQGLEVVGVDNNEDIVEKLNAGEVHLSELNVEGLLREVMAAGKFRASARPETADVFILNVPTPLNAEHEPDTSHLRSVTEQIVPLLRPGNLFIIESTCPVGTTDDFADSIFTARPELRGQVFVAYCPERALPGNLLFEFRRNDRIIGGIDQASTRHAMDFYSLLVKGKLFPTYSKTAEMCKLTENCHRDMQIAFANELSVICDKAGVNVWDLIELANKHPRVNILQPGCGVGGKYIAVDPYYIISSFSKEARLLKTVREINDLKAEYCVAQVRNAMLEFEVNHHRKPTVAMMGLTYKPNIDDLRHSPAKYIVTQVMQNCNNADILIAEPNLREHNVFKLTDFKTAYERADIVVFLTAHTPFLSLQYHENKKILDFCGIFKNRNTGELKMKNYERSDAESAYM